MPKMPIRKSEAVWLMLRPVVQLWRRVRCWRKGHDGWLFIRRTGPSYVKCTRCGKELDETARIDVSTRSI